MPLQRAHQRHAAARHHALFDGRAGRMQRVFDARLLLLHLDLGAAPTLITATPPASFATRSWSFSLIVVGGGVLDFLVDLLDAALDVRALAGAVDDRGVLLGDLDLLGFAEVVQRRLLERQADFLGDHLAAGQDRDVLQHGLAAITEARRLHGRDLHDAADVVHHQRRKRLAFDVLRDDQQRPARLGDAFEQRQQLADVRDLLVVDQDQRVLERRRLALLDR